MTGQRLTGQRPTDVARVPAIANALAPVASAPRVSVLVPAKDEAENLPEFMRQAAEAFSKTPGMYEVVVIDDGSVDDTPAVLARLEREYPFLRTVRHRFRRGIADALRTGYAHSRGEVLVFYPADLQFKPADIPKLVDPVLAGDVDIMTGRKEGEYEKAFDLQPPESLALPRSGARSQLGQGVSSRRDGNRPRAPGLASLHGRHGCGKRILGR